MIDRNCIPPPLATRGPWGPVSDTLSRTPGPELSDRASAMSLMQGRMIDALSPGNKDDSHTCLRSCVNLSPSESPPIIVARDGNKERNRNRGWKGREPWTDLGDLIISIIRLTVHRPPKKGLCDHDAYIRVVGVQLVCP